MEKAENVEIREAKQAQDKEGAVLRGFPGVRGSPSKADSETQIAKATAKKLRIPFVDPLRARIEPGAVGLLDPQIAVRRQVLPIRRVGDTLLVAMASPEQSIAVRSLEILTGCRVRPAAAPKSSLASVLRHVYEQPAKGASKVEQEVLEAIQDKRAEDIKTCALSVSVISSKGGVGKTHLSINLAYTLAKSQGKVLLIDTDLGNADLSTKLGIFPDAHLLDFLAKDRQMKDLVVKTRFNFDLICGTYGNFELANLNHAQKMRFIRHFKVVSQMYDTAVFDLGAGIARTVMDFALGVDHTVIVTTPKDVISGYACAKAAFFRFKQIEERLEGKLPGYKAELTFSPMLVVNQVDNLKQGVKIYDNLQRIADKNINSGEARFRMRPQYLGSIPYDRETFRKAEGKRSPFVSAVPYAKASQCVRRMSTKFGSPDVSNDPKVKPRHPFKRFFAVLSQRI
jgi:flagellar biosynthesis protein FlhG